LSSHQQDLVDNLLPKIGVPEGALDLKALFPKARGFAFEVGFGGGEHLAAQAGAHPDIGYIGCEPFLNGVAKLLTQIDAAKLKNVRVHPDDARDVLPRLPSESLSAFYVLFPDPWPKLRHHKRRFIQSKSLDELARVLKPGGGELRLATDHADYALWALQHLMADRRFRWTADCAADWRVRPADWPATRYEQKALKAGRACVYLRFLRV
jgi:tRNA (guanine-N7-)-methyltransferase